MTFSLSVQSRAACPHSSPPSPSLRVSLSTDTPLQVRSAEGAREAAKPVLIEKLVFIFSACVYKTIKRNLPLDAPKSSKRVGILTVAPGVCPEETNKKKQITSKVRTIANDELDLTTLKTFAL